MNFNIENVRVKLDTMKAGLKEDECWLGNSINNGTGYARIMIDDHYYSIHRISAWVYNGFDINSELYICHLPTCPRNCWNPAHLRIDDAKGNRSDSTQGAWGVALNNSRVTHCINGHEYNDVNTYVAKDGHRSCKACMKVQKHRSYLRSKKRWG